MARLKRILSEFLLGLERDFHTFRREFNRFRRDRPFDIVPYLSYGSSTRVYLKGRVMEDKSLAVVTPDTPRWRNFVNTYKRFVNDKVPGARLEIDFVGLKHEVKTDAKGYFETWLEPPADFTPQDLWQEVGFTLLEPRRDKMEPAVATGSVLIPTRDAQFGVISDMDDTVIQTDVTKWLRVVGTVLFGNAYTRLPFKGVAAFYTALQQGTRGGHNPLFYVSSSPWNLYDLILRLLRIEGIPLGPIMLRNWRSGGGELFPSEHGSFKKGEVQRILDTYPGLPFILIGDSGEQDPEIYSDVVASYPGRILAVYIRNVSENDARATSIRELADNVQTHGSKLVLADDTLAAAKHAAAEGWILESALPEIRDQKTKHDALFEGHEETVATVFDPSPDAPDLSKSAEARP